jgi:glycoprotein endo-alpha-1,2-mannosidase
MSSISSQKRQIVSPSTQRGNKEIEDWTIFPCNPFHEEFQVSEQKIQNSTVIAHTQQLCHDSLNAVELIFGINPNTDVLRGQAKQPVEHSDSPIPSRQKSQRTQSSDLSWSSFLSQSRQITKANNEQLNCKYSDKETIEASSNAAQIEVQIERPIKRSLILKNHNFIDLENVHKFSDSNVTLGPSVNLEADNQREKNNSKEEFEFIPSLFDDKSKTKTHSESSTGSFTSDKFEDDSYFIQSSILRYKPILLCLLTLCTCITFFMILMLGLSIGAAIRGEQISLKNIFSPGSSTQLQLSIENQSSSAPSAMETIKDTSSPTTIFTTRPSSSPSNLLQPSPSPSNLLRPSPSPNLKKKITVGAYYYPWHGKNFHNGQGYLRKELNQSPKLGEYDDRDPSIIGQHLAWSRQANIDLWITSWWGPNRLEDNTTRDVILTHQELGNHKIALFYETSGRIKEENDFDVSNVELDIDHMCNYYFDHPNYFRINERPVLFMYLTRKLETTGNFEEAILLMRSVADNCGHNLFVVGDHAFAAPPSEEKTYRPFLYLDAVTNYDVYGSMRTTGYAGQEVVNEYYYNQKLWRKQASDNKCGFIPAVSPGYNDRGVRLDADHEPLSRRLSRTAEEGSLFKAGIQHAKYLVDEIAGDLLVVNSFNEWHEDSQIEPAVGDTTDEPFKLTLGLDYVGYDDLYLDILREETLDFYPDENQLE